MAKNGSNKRIAINTAVIYCRLVLTLGISLFSTRYVLEALGETNFGLYNVIAGVVSMFSFIAATMATTTQRFISFTMGETDDVDKIKQVVGGSITMHVLVSLAVAAIVLIGGAWMIENILTIPHGMHQAAYFVLFSVCFGLIGTINSVPFEAMLMAHENILFVSICQIINTYVKFGGAVLLLYIDIDRLKVYATIMACQPFILLALESWFCLKHYPEVKISRKDLKPSLLMREFGKFAGWVMIGTTCLTMRTQGVSILLNMFWGVIVNAANGVATQVSSTLQFFSTSITTSLRPQLIKSAGEGDTKRMMTLIFAASKYTLLLLTLAGCPLIVAMPYILSIWLKVVPEYTVDFCRIMIVCTLLRQSYMGLVIGLEAKGKIVRLQLFAGLSYLLVLPAGYLFAKSGFGPNFIFMCVAASEVLILIYLVFLSNSQIGLPKIRFCVEVYLRCAIVALILYIINYSVWECLDSSFIMLVVLGFTDLIAFSALCLLIGLNGRERTKILGSVVKLIRKYS